MELGGGSNKRRLKEACRSLFTLVIGFLSCSSVSVLTYFTYQTVFGNKNYCTLWTDIPGRLAIFVTFYYAAGSCGSLPIPERFRIQCLPKPFILYKLQSWTCLFRNLRRLLTFNCSENQVSVSDDPESPLLRQRSSEAIPITKTDAPTNRIRPRKAARNRCVSIADSFEKSSMSFDSPIGGHIVPMVKGRSSKPRYFPESSLTSTESSDQSTSAMAPSVTLRELSGSDQENTAIRIKDEMDTPPRTPDVELPLPSYPRFPWSLLKYRRGLPQEARALHKRHLMAERRELDKHNKKQRMEKTVQQPNDKASECEWITDSDDFNPIANRPLRLPPNPPRRKVGFRGRTRTTPDVFRMKSGKSKIQTRRRAVSSSAPQETRLCAAIQSSPDTRDNPDQLQEIKCCENSPNLQEKVDRIQRMLTRLGPTFQAGGEASTSKAVFGSKIPDRTEPTQSPDKADEEISFTTPEF